MKAFIARYMLYIYMKFIKDDEIDIFKKWAIPFIHITLFIRSVYIWIASIIFFPIFIFGMIFEDKFEKQLKKMIEMYNLKNDIYLNN